MKLRLLLFSSGFSDSSPLLTVLPCVLTALVPVPRFLICSLFLVFGLLTLFISLIADSFPLLGSLTCVVGLACP